MARVVLRADPSIARRSANDSDYPTDEWLHNPPSFESLWEVVPGRYWKLSLDGTDVEEMSQPEKDAADQRIESERVASARSLAIAELEGPPSSESIRTRALLHQANRRINWLTNRVIQLQNVVEEMLESVGGATNMRAAGITEAARPFPAAQNSVHFAATATRDRQSTTKDFRDDVAAGNQDGA